jgi:hypothetical protein
MKNKFNYSEISVEEAMAQLDQFGWLIYENALEPAFVDQINDSLETAYEKRREIQKSNGISQNMEGTLHHLI